MNRIETSSNSKKTGKIEAGGYIWHTTGSGKTLTSFKTAQLATNLPYIDKVLFVVDRKDLDYQTIKEYDRFEKGAANSNKSTGTDVDRIMPPVSRFGGGSRDKKKQTVIEKLKAFFEKYFGLVQI